MYFVPLLPFPHIVPHFPSTSYESYVILFSRARFLFLTPLSSTISCICCSHSSLCILFYPNLFWQLFFSSFINLRILSCLPSPTFLFLKLFWPPSVSSPVLHHDFAFCFHLSKPVCHTVALLIVHSSILYFTPPAKSLSNRCRTHSVAFPSVQKCASMTVCCAGVNMYVCV